MSGNVVPTTGNIYLRTAPSSTNNAIFEVFGTPAENNLNGLRDTVYDDPTVRPPPLTTDTPLTVPASGNVSMALFRGKSKFMTTPSVPLISSLSSTSLTPTLTGGSGTYYIAVGTTAGASDTTGGWKAATSGTAITTKQNGTTALSFAYATPYYISVYDSNTTKTTASRTLSNSTVYGIPNAPTNITLTLTTLTSWKIDWSLSTGTVLPTGYSWYLLGGTVTYYGTVTSTTTSTSQSSTLDQNTSYYAQVVATRPEATMAQNSTTKSLDSPSTISAVTATLVAGTASGSASYTPSIPGGGGGTLYIGFGTAAVTPTIQWSSGAVTPSIAITAGTSYYVSAFSRNTITGTQTSTGYSGALTIPDTPTFTTYSITDTTFNAVATSTSGATISYTISPVPSGGTATKSTGTWTGLTVNTQYTVTATATMTMTTTTTGSAVWCLAPPVVGNPTINLQSMSYPFTVSTNATGAVISNVFGAQAAVVTPAVITRAASTTATTYASNTLVKYVIIATGPNTTYTSTVQYFCIVDPTTKATVTMPPSITSFTYYLVGGTGGIGVSYAGSKRYGGGSYGGTLYGTTASTASYGGKMLTLLTGTNGYDGRTDKSLTERAICGDGYSGGNGGYGVFVYASGGGEGGSSGSGGAASMILCSSPNLMIVAGGGGGTGAGYNQSGGGGWAGSTMPNPSPGGGGTSYYNNYYDSSGGGSGSTTYGGQGGVNGTGGASGSNMPAAGYPAHSGSNMSSTVTALTSTSGDGGDANGVYTGSGTVGGGGGGGYGGGGAGASRNTGTYIESGGGGGGASFISDSSGTIAYGGVVPVIIVYGTI